MVLDYKPSMPNPALPQNFRFHPQSCQKHWWSGFAAHHIVVQPFPFEAFHLASVCITPAGKALKGGWEEPEVEVMSYIYIYISSCSSINIESYIYIYTFNGNVNWGLELKNGVNMEDYWASKGQHVSSGNCEYILCKKPFMQSSTIHGFRIWHTTKPAVG